MSENKESKYERLNVEAKKIIEKNFKDYSSRDLADLVNSELEKNYSHVAVWNYMKKVQESDNKQQEIMSKLLGKFVKLFTDKSVALAIPTHKRNEFATNLNPDELEVLNSLA